MLEGHDAWGTKLIYTVDPAQKMITITSAGPNRRYDGGHVDDLSTAFEYDP